MTDSCWACRSRAGEHKLVCIGLRNDDAFVHHHDMSVWFLLSWFDETNKCDFFVPASTQVHCLDSLQSSEAPRLVTLSKVLSTDTERTLGLLR
jgi:hypothetical protein